MDNDAFGAGKNLRLDNQSPAPSQPLM